MNTSPELADEVTRAWRVELSPQPPWHPIREDGQAGTTVAGLTFDDCFQDIPTPLQVAHLMRLAEESQYPLSRSLAAILQIAARASPVLAQILSQLATLMVDAGCVRPGGAVEGLSVARDLERLLAVRNGDPLAILDPDTESPLEETLVMARARLERGEGDTDRLVALVGRLEAEIRGEKVARRAKPEPSDGATVDEMVTMTLDHYESMLDQLQSLRHRVDILSADIRSAIERTERAGADPPPEDLP